MDVQSASPPDARAVFYGAQIIRSAREVDFFTNLSDGTWWTRMHLNVLGTTLRYCAVIQRVGHGDTGVLAMTSFAETLPPKGDEEEDRPLPAPAFRLSPKNSVTLVYGDDESERWPELAAAIDETMAAAIDFFTQSLS